MSSVVDICNISLGLIGLEPIQTLGENSDSARACSRFYDKVRKVILRGYPWRFAQTMVYLAAASSIPTGANHYDYAYTYPADALLLLGSVQQSDGTWLKDYEVTSFRQSGTVFSKYILSNTAQLKMAYTVDLEDTTRFDVLFEEVLENLLAYRLVKYLSNDLSTAQKIYQDYIDALASATTADGLEATTPQQQTDDWITERTEDF